MFFKFSLFLLLALGLSACSLLQRHPHSGYYNSQYKAQSAALDFYEQRRHHTENRARMELGLPDARPLTEEERKQLDLRISLHRREQQLETRREKKQYYKYKSYMEDDQERLYFLSLPSIEVREQWAQSQGITETDEAYGDTVADAIEDNDIILGMTPKAVQESWGDPDAVEVAGDPVYGNQRWKYAKYVSSADGYRKEHRYIYFEAGRVVGWEKF